MTELIIGETYKLNTAYHGRSEYLIIAKSPVTGNFIGENIKTQTLSKFTNDGRRVDRYGIKDNDQLYAIPKEKAAIFPYSWI